jgi:hypothetical protein
LQAVEELESITAVAQELVDLRFIQAKHYRLVHILLQSVLVVLVHHLMAMAL